MIRRGFVVLLLAGVMMAITPLAHAELPDQTWIPGLYDNADYDDVVLLVTSGADAVEMSAPPDFGSILTVVELVPLHDESRPPGLARSSNSARAPPAV